MNWKRKAWGNARVRYWFLPFLRTKIDTVWYSNKIPCNCLLSFFLSSAFWWRDFTISFASLLYNIMSFLIQKSSIEFYDTFKIRRCSCLSSVQVDLRSDELNDGHSLWISFRPMDYCSIRNWSYLQSRHESWIGPCQVFVNALTNYSGIISEPFTLLLR